MIKYTIIILPVSEYMIFSIKMSEAINYWGDVIVNMYSSLTKDKNYHHCWINYLLDLH